MADIVNVSSEPLVHVIEEAAIPVLWQGKRADAPDCWQEPRADMIELWQWEMQPGERFTSSGHPAGTFELLRERRHINPDGGRDGYAGCCRGIGGGETEAAHGYANEGKRCCALP